MTPYAQAVQRSLQWLCHLRHQKLLSLICLVALVTVIIVCHDIYLFMAALLYFCTVISIYLSILFFPRLISAAAGWMATIL